MLLGKSSLYGTGFSCTRVRQPVWLFHPWPKTEWMNKNPRVCVEFDEITNPFQWSSVIVDGHYLELTEPQYSQERAHARELLSNRYRWWQTATAERQLRSGDALMHPIFFRVLIDSMTGLQAVDEPVYGGLTA